MSSYAGWAGSRGLRGVGVSRVAACPARIPPCSLCGSRGGAVSVGGGGRVRGRGRLRVCGAVGRGCTAAAAAAAVCCSGLGAAGPCPVRCTTRSPCTVRCTAGGGSAVCACLLLHRSRARLVRALSVSGTMMQVLATPIPCIDGRSMA